MKKTLLMMSIILFLASCSNLRQVETDELNREGEIYNAVKDHSNVDFNSVSTIQVDRRWWESFKDPTLDDLIDQVVMQNIDLQLLVNRVDLARLAVEDADFDKIPKVNAAISQPSGINSNNSAYSSHSKLNAHVSWEADIWGRIEAAGRGAESELKATESDYRGAYLKVINDMANVYFNIRMLDEQKDLHEWAIKDTNDILRLYIEREKAGLTNKTRSASQKAEVLRLQSDLVNIERQREVLILQLNLLLGNAPHEVTPTPQALTQFINIPAPPQELNFDLIGRRPDVIAADYRMREAYYNEESARVARLPKLSVGLDYTMSGASLASLTDNWVLSVLPRISFPALDPATKTELKRRGIVVDMKQTEYKKALLEAVSDVEEAILNIKYRRQQLEIEKERMDQLKLSYTKVMNRFETGVISHLEVLEASRTLVNSRQRYLDNYREVLAQTSHMYIALGGGW